MPKTQNIKPLPLLLPFEVTPKALEVAKGFEAAKLRETHGTNRSPQIDKMESFWGLIGQPYCAMFFWFCQAKGYLHKAGLPTTDAYIKLALEMLAKRFCATSARCTEIMTDAKRRGIWRDGAKNILPGDAVLFQFDNDPQAEHIGRFVAYVLDPKLGACVRCIEGNTGSGQAGSQDDGDGVHSRNRPYHVVMGSVRLS